MYHKQALNVTAEINWEQVLRYKLIEVVALWEGRLTTNHLCNSFSIKRQQASRDIAAYISLFDDKPLVYDRSIKGYRPSEKFVPKFTQGVPDEYLSLLNKYHNDHVDGFNLKGMGKADAIVLDVPDRTVSPIIVRRLLQAARECRRVDIDYVSLDNPTERGRNIVPHTICHDGFRWHVRAYCEERGNFRDFVLSRFRNEPEILSKSPITKDQDVDWFNHETVEIIANPYLSGAQQRIVETDFSMKNGRYEIECRRALIKYLIKRLNICTDGRKLKNSPKKYQLAVANKQQIKKWLL